MIFETIDEKEAFEFVCKLADYLTSRNGCNDLPSEDEIKFKHILVETEEDNKIVMRPICYDFDVIFWLKRQGKLK
jgi:hypothetical protein